MSEKKPILISVEKNPHQLVREAFFASSFNIRTDWISEWLVEILFLPGVGSLSVFNLVLDLSPARENSARFTKYVSELTGPVDENAVSEKIPYVRQSAYANIFQCSSAGQRSETLFGLHSIHDIANVRHKAQSGSVNLISFDPILAVYGSIGFQKKLISEILKLISIKG
jgi:hypothetical protein